MTAAKLAAAPLPPAVNHIAIINRSSLDDVEVSVMVAAYEDWLDAACQAWGVATPGMAVYGRNHQQAIAEEAAGIFTDSGDQPDAFGWHTALGLARWFYVDLGMCRAFGEPPSRVFGHELIEMPLDPDCNIWFGPTRAGYHVAMEGCDPVQRDSIAVDGTAYGNRRKVELADFILPSWFDEGASQGPFSYLNRAPAPLTIAPGGYYLRERNGLVTSEGMLRVKSHGRTLKRLVTKRQVAPAV
jgi:hypothetical protein